MSIKTAFRQTGNLVSLTPRPSKCFVGNSFANLARPSSDAGDERCCVRRDFENANSVSERQLFFFPVATLKSNILVQLFSFTLPARITASSVKHMSGGEKKSVGESSAEAKGNAKRKITSFYVSGDAVFFPFARKYGMNVIIAQSQCSAAYCLSQRCNFFPFFCMSF